MDCKFSDPPEFSPSGTWPTTCQPTLISTCPAPSSETDPSEGRPEGIRPAPPRNSGLATLSRGGAARLGAWRLAWSQLRGRWLSFPAAAVASISVPALRTARCREAACGRRASGGRVGLLQRCVEVGGQLIEIYATRL